MLPVLSGILSNINGITRVGQPRASHTEPLNEPPYATSTHSHRHCDYPALAIPHFFEVNESC